MRCDLKEPPMRNHLLKSLLASSLLLLAACGREEAKVAEAPPLVRAFQTARTGEDAVELRGTVVPRERLRLGFKAPGILKAMKVREGDRVQAGQVLAVLDDLDARSQSRVAQASLDRARREAERAARLVQEGALPAIQREDTRNQLESAEALWRQAVDGVNRTRILAPLSGTIHQRLAEPGEAVGAGVPVLVLDSADHPVVRTGVPERELASMKPGRYTEILEPGGGPRVARITSVASAPGDDGLYAVEVVPVAGRLRTGSLVQVRVPFAPEPGRVRIPFSALVNRQGHDLVAFLQPAGKDFKVWFHPVKVDKADGHGVILRQGLGPGERIVSEGAFSLQDGQTVRILE